MLLPLKFSGTRMAVGALLLFSPMCVAAQDSPVYNRARAIDETHSQAEREAEQTVSLSAEKLISLLQKETGLLLEVKKLLVRKAFDQGRILESRDLTDEALFRLLREDENIRVLATQEVTKRQYIQALPTREERQRETSLCAGPFPSRQEDGSVPEAPDKTGSARASKEDRYWSDQSRRSEGCPQRPETLSNTPNYSPNYSPNNPPSTRGYNPQAPQGLPGTQPEPERDSRRAVEQAEMQDSDDFDGMPTDSGSMGLGSMGAMERIGPEDLPGLIRARSEQQTAPGSSGSLGGSLNQQTLAEVSRLPTHPSFPQASLDTSAERTSLDSHRDRTSLSLPPFPRDDHASLCHRANPYADVPSLYDLNTQYGRRSAPFGR